MPRNKLNFDQKTKLNKFIDEKEESQEDRLNIIKQEIKAFPTSFRLRKIDIERLEDSLRKINSINISHPFNKACLIRGLIMLSIDTKPEKILEYIRKSL